MNNLNPRYVLGRLADSDEPVLQICTGYYSFSYHNIFRESVLHSNRKSDFFTSFDPDANTPFITSDFVRRYPYGSYLRPPCVMFHDRYGACLIAANNHIIPLDMIKNGSKNLYIGVPNVHELEYPPVGFKYGVTNRILSYAI